MAAANAGAGARPGRLDGPFHQVGGDRARDPQPHRQPLGGPVQLEADMGPRIQRATLAQQPGQVAPQRVGGARLDLRRRQDADQPRTGGQPLLAPPPPAPRRRHADQPDREGHGQQPQPPAGRHPDQLAGELAQGAPGILQPPLQRRQRQRAIGGGHHAGCRRRGCGGQLRRVAGDQSMLGG